MFEFILMYSPVKQVNQSIIHSFIHSFIHPFNHPFTYSPFYSLIHSFFHLSFHTSIQLIGWLILIILKWKLQESRCLLSSTITGFTIKLKTWKYRLVTENFWIYRVTHKGGDLSDDYGIYAVYFLIFMIPCNCKLISVFLKSLIKPLKDFI